MLQHFFWGPVEGNFHSSFICVILPTHTKTQIGGDHKSPESCWLINEGLSGLSLYVAQFEKQI